MEMITSTANDRVKKMIKYRKSARMRRQDGVFLVEGARMFSEIPDDRLLESYVTQAFLDVRGQEIPASRRQTLQVVSPHVMQAMTDTQTPQGVVSLVRQHSYSETEICKGATPLILALENLQDPGNLGTIIRTAEGAGVTGIVMSADTVDVYNPKVVRATMGSIFRVPFCYVNDLTGWLIAANQSGFESYAAHLHGTTFYDFNYTKPTIFCIGNEGNGLTETLTKAANHKISIPMMGNVESLNAATAATVLMYEAMRQKNDTSRQN